MKFKKTTDREADKINLFMVGVPPTNDASKTLLATTLAACLEEFVKQHN